MLVKIFSVNPSERELSRVVDVLEHDGVIIYPTDSIYAQGHRTPAYVQGQE